MSVILANEIFCHILITIFSLSALQSQSCTKLTWAVGHHTTYLLCRVLNSCNHAITFENSRKLWTKEPKTGKPGTIYVFVTI